MDSVMQVLVDPRKRHLTARVSDGRTIRVGDFTFNASTFLAAVQSAGYETVIGKGAQQLHIFVDREAGPKSLLELAQKAGIV